MMCTVEISSRTHLGANQKTPKTLNDLSIRDSLDSRGAFWSKVEAVRKPPKPPLKPTETH